VPHRGEVNGLMAWMTPKYDWTATDLYNFADMNRVENNIDAVRIILLASGYSLPTMTIVTNRTIYDYELVSSVNRLEANLEALRVAFNATPDGYLPRVTWTASTGFTFADANRWERNIELLYKAINSATRVVRYSGTFAAGEEVLG
jgi:hypothetical protein